MQAGRLAVVIVPVFFFCVTPLRYVVACISHRSVEPRLFSNALVCCNWSHYLSTKTDLVVSVYSVGAVFLARRNQMIYPGNLQQCSSPLRGRRRRRRAASACGSNCRCSCRPPPQRPGVGGVPVGRPSWRRFQLICDY